MLPFSCLNSSSCHHFTLMVTLSLSAMLPIFYSCLVSLKHCGGWRQRREVSDSRGWPVPRPDSEGQSEQGPVPRNSTQMWRSALLQTISSAEEWSKLCVLSFCSLIFKFDEIKIWIPHFLEWPEERVSGWSDYTSKACVIVWTIFFSDRSRKYCCDRNIFAIKCVHF